MSALYTIVRLTNHPHVVESNAKNEEFKHFQPVKLYIRAIKTTQTLYFEDNTIWVITLEKKCLNY